MTVSATQRRGLDRLGYWCSRHGARVVLAWLFVLVAATLAHHALGGSYTDDFSLPGTTSQQGADVLKAHEPAAGGMVLAAGFVSSAVVGFVVVRFLLRYLRTHTLKPFAIYLAALGIVLLAVGLAR